MYIPKLFEETELAAMQALMLAHPLATLVTMGPDGLDANPIPLLFTPGESGHGVLRGHVARANPIWQRFDPAVGVLAVFSGEDAYISPSWYASKREHGKVVPTWNYERVNAHGTLRTIDDAAWLCRLLHDLTAQQEAVFDQPWSIEDAPADYIEKLLGAIVGIEIEVTRLEGKWKVSQNQPAENRASVIAALQAVPGGAAMAELVRERGK